MEDFKDFHEKGLRHGICGSHGLLGVVNWSITPQGEVLNTA